MADQTVERKLVVTEKIGIGITEPIAELHLFSADSNRVFLQSDRFLLKVSIDNTSATLGTEAGTTLPFALQTNGNNRLSIASDGNTTLTGPLTVQNALTVSGNVSIGTITPPAATLQVNGVVAATSFRGDAAGLTGLQIPPDTITDVQLADNAVVDSTLANGAVTTPKLAEGAVTLAKLEAAARPWVMNGDRLFYSNGNVAIGSEMPPAERLEVNGTVKATSFQGDGSGLVGVVKTAGDTITGELTVQQNLRVLGNLEVTGKTGFHSPLNVEGRITAHANWVADEGALLLKGDKPTIKFTGEAIAGNQSWILHVGSNGPGNLEFFNQKGASNWASVLSMTPSGNVGIGTIAPVLGLDVRGPNAWVGSGDSSQTVGGWRLGRWPAYSSANTWVYLSRADSAAYQDLAIGTLWAGGATRFGTADDLAEMTPTKAEDDLEPGDVVVLAEPPDDRVLLKKSYQPYDRTVAGVISDPVTAGLMIGGSQPTDCDRPDLKPLALAGRVLTKVSTENGSIQVGDFLVTASQAGYAMKATTAGYTLGKAMQSFRRENSASTGKIWVLVNLGWFGCES